MNGPGELTLTSIVLFTLGAYGIAAGAAAGEQSVVAVGVFAFALFVVGIIWPIVALSNVQVDAWTPADGTVGEPFDVHLRLQGRVARVEVRILEPPGQWWVTASPASGVIGRIAKRRGVFDHLRIELRTSAPIGVFVRSRVLRVELPIELTVAPQPTSAPVRPAATPRVHERPHDGVISLTSPPGQGAGDTVRAVRPYVPGDAARLVHWPSSARRGTLVVRDHEPPATLGIAIVVDLNGPADEVEEAASRAAGIGRATFAAGGAVWCCTNEERGPVSARVADQRELGRRLARATAGEPASAPPGWPVEVVRS